MSNLLDQQIPVENQRSNVFSEKVKVTAAEFGAKVKGKTECYNLLSHEWGAYLPHPELITVYHLRDLASGVKKPIKGRDIKHLHIPQYDHLTIEEFMKFAKDYPFVLMHLPDRLSEIKKMPRQYIINIIHTKLEDKFR